MRASSESASLIPSRPLPARAHAHTHVSERDVCHQLRRCSVYLLSWYKSTNTALTCALARVHERVVCYQLRPYADFCTSKASKLSTRWWPLPARAHVSTSALYVITCGAMCVSLLALLVQKHKYRRFHHLRRDARHLHAVKELHKKKMQRSVSICTFVPVKQVN